MKASYILEINEALEYNLDLYKRKREYFYKSIVFECYFPIVFKHKSVYPTFAPMKLFFTFMSLFMIYLSCIPCNDGMECNDEEKISLSDNQKEHKHTQEACTPFCTCSCCATIAYYSPIQKTDDAKIIFQSEKFSYNNIVLNTEVYYSIWQPPKASA